MATLFHAKKDNDSKSCRLATKLGQSLYGYMNNILTNFEAKRSIGWIVVRRNDKKNAFFGKEKKQFH
jgi:hypothetical protein